MKVPKPVLMISKLDNLEINGKRLSFIDRKCSFKVFCLLFFHMTIRKHNKKISMLNKNKDAKCFGVNT